MIVLHHSIQIVRRIAVLVLIAAWAVAMSRCDRGDGNNSNRGGVVSSRPPDKALAQADIQEIDRPGMLGVGGYVLAIVRSEAISIPATVVQLPELPARRAPIVLYLRLPAGEAERFKAAGGTAEFVLHGKNKSIGGQVQLADLRVTTSPHLPGDLMYADDVWVESLDEGLDWQPETATVTISSEANDVDGPIEAVMMVGGSK